MRIRFGEYSIAYRKAEADLEIVKKIQKNKYNYDLIVRNKRTNIYDIVHYHIAKNITESYGYKINDCLGDKNEGDTIKSGDFLYKSDNYDDDGNFLYGRNLKAVFLAYDGLTYEDGVVISKKAAEKMTSYKCETITVSVNGNDILINLYGDDQQYQSFPKIGEYTKNKILTASRRKDKRTVLYDLQASKIQSPDPVSDDITFTEGGTVVDIDIFSNASIQEMRKRANLFNKEILDVAENNYRYWTEMATALEEIIPVKVLSENEIRQEREEFGHVVKHPLDRKKNSKKYTDELAYYWKLAHEYIDDKIPWRYDGKSFDNVKLTFTILKENPLTPGSKVTGRYGNKGVITKIVDTEKPGNDWPTTEDGQQPDVILNPLGVWNRLNPAQLQEQFLNFVADHVLKEMGELTDIKEKEKLYLSFIEYINKKQYNFVKSELKQMSVKEKQEFIQSIETDGIYMHQPPFFGNMGDDDFRRIYREHPEWCSEYKFENIEKPMTMGDIYFIRLKHEASNKTSVRSASTLNVKGLPAKSTLKKEHKTLMSSTPIRLGEMEVSNLFLSKRPDLVEKLLKTYSTNEYLRESLIKQLINPGQLPDGHLRNSLNMDIECDLKDNKGISREILDKYLSVLGYALSDDDYSGGDNEQ